MHLGQFEVEQMCDGQTAVVTVQTLQKTCKLLVSHGERSSGAREAFGSVRRGEVQWRGGARTWRNNIFARCAPQLFMHHVFVPREAWAMGAADCRPS